MDNSKNKDDRSDGRIGMGVIGLGRSGRDIHVETLRQHPHFRLVAVSDTLDDRLDLARKDWGCRAYADYQGMLADPDVDWVVVATPSFTHLPITLAALQAGKHVLVEKPMAVSVAEADQMIAAAKAADRMLSIFQNRRFDPDLALVRQIIASGKLGRIVFIRRGSYGFDRRNDWQALKKYGGGLLNNWGSHLLDQMLILLDYDVRDLSADVQQTIGAGDAEDHVKVLMRNDSLSLEIELLSTCAFNLPSWLITGTLGSVVERDGHLICRYVDPATLAPLPKIDEIAPYSDFTYPHEKITWQEESFEIPPINLHRAYYDALYETIAHGQPLVVKPEQVREVLRTIERIKAKNIAA